MTAHHLAAIEAALMAIKPPGVLSIDVRYQYGFDVTMVFGDGDKLDTASAFDCPTLAQAFAKADLNRLRKIAAKRTAHDIAAAEVASWAPAARPGWPIARVDAALVAEREGVN